jgi:hypothetical protein
LATAPTKWDVPGYRETVLSISYSCTPFGCKSTYDGCCFSGKHFYYSDHCLCSCIMYYHSSEVFRYFILYFEISLPSSTLTSLFQSCMTLLRWITKSLNEQVCVNKIISLIVTSITYLAILLLFDGQERRIKERAVDFFYLYDK